MIGILVEGLGVWGILCGDCGLGKNKVKVVGKKKKGMGKISGIRGGELTLKGR